MRGRNVGGCAKPESSCAFEFQLAFDVNIKTPKISGTSPLDLAIVRHADHCLHS